MVLAKLAWPYAKVKYTLNSWKPCYHDFKIVSFNDKATEDIFNSVNSKLARKACPQTLWRIAARKLDQLDSVQSLEELKVPSGIGQVRAQKGQVFIFAAKIKT